MTIMRAINAAQRYFTHKFRHSENEVMNCQRHMPNCQLHSYKDHQVSHSQTQLRKHYP